MSPISKSNEGLSIALPYRFLFVDDSSSYRKFLQLLLSIKKLPVIAHYASNANDALVYLNKCTEQDFPDVIMSDLEMPHINGFEFMEKYLASYSEKNALLIITSSTEEIRHKKQLATCPHIDGFIQKPLSNTIFNEQILTKLQARLPFSKNTTIL